MMTALLLTLAALAVVVEEVLEHLKTQFEFVTGWVIHVLKYALGVGAVLALKFQLLDAFDLFDGIDGSYFLDMSIATAVLVGLFVGSGSSLINAVVEYFVGRGNRWSKDSGLPRDGFLPG